MRNPVDLTYPIDRYFKDDSWFAIFMKLLIQEIIDIIYGVQTRLSWMRTKFMLRNPNTYILYILYDIYGVNYTIRYDIT